jgi:hypothetical protein
VGVRLAMPITSSPIFHKRSSGQRGSIFARLYVSVSSKECHLTLLSYCSARALGHSLSW